MRPAKWARNGRSRWVDDLNRALTVGDIKHGRMKRTAVVFGKMQNTTSQKVIVMVCKFIKVAVDSKEVFLEQKAA